MAMNKVEYRVAFLNLPLVSVSIMVDEEDVCQFEEWLINEQDNSIIHAAGGSVEY